MASATPTPELDVPRVLLFGHRGAGKSALIGALLKAGETQGDVLRGEVTHSSVDLPRIRDAVYSGGKLESHTTELVSYTIRLKPWRVDGKPVGDPLTVILDDCDGKAAEELLESPEPITHHAPNSPVARAVIETDAIVLLVDAASTDAELEEAFAEFDTFLTVVERAKTDAREVGGFPVYLVLTQCDRLARPGDSRDAWEDRVDVRVAHASHKFSEFLKEAGEEEGGTPSPFLAFGSVEFEVFAVAVRAPALPGAPSAADLPYKVAELFRDCFAAARAHHDRARASDVRLKWTVRLAAAAMSVMLLVLALVALFPPRNEGPTLAERVEDYLLGEPPAAERLSDARIERNKGALATFKADRGFRALEPRLQQFVDGRLKEIDDYKAYRRKLLNAPPPASCRSLPDLNAVRDTLNGELALPPEYGWGPTAAGELRRKWLADCAAIAGAEKRLVDAYRESDSAATALTLRRSFDSDWLKDIDALVARGDRPPFPLSDPLPGSFAIDQPGGEVVTYRVPYEFDEVYHARRYWEQSRDRIVNLRDLADALGATVAPDRPPPVLVIPEPDGGDSSALAGARLKALAEKYPRHSEGYPEWDVRGYPDPARSDLTARLKKSFEAGARHVNAMLRPEDTKEGWKAAAAKLNAPAYREWGRLLHLIARLYDPTAPDPVAEMANVLTDLDTRTFDIDVPAFELVIPLELTVGFERVIPKDAFTITLTHGTEPPVALKYAVGPGTTRDKTTVYRLTREGGGKLSYRAGDDLRAELPVDAGKQPLKLVWEAPGSGTFRFDRLAREPRLTRATGGTDAAPGVRLTPVPGGALPKLPALMAVK